MLKENSHSRLTLALDIIGKLEEGEFAGYHELNLIKQEIDIHDTITVEDSENMEIVCDTPDVPLDDKNLCWKAAELLKEMFKLHKNVKITIKKQIPPQAGMAAGSSNAATTLKLLNRLWNLSLNTEQLIDIGRKLGMDVPFYFLGETAFDTESTKILQPLLNEKKLHYVIVLPDFGISTKEAYQNIDYDNIAKNTPKTQALQKALEEGNVQGIADNTHNDFENSVFTSHPQLINIKQNLINAGAVTALMSGSGSAVFGITETKEQAEEIKDKLTQYNTLVAETK